MKETKEKQLQVLLRYEMIRVTIGRDEISRSRERVENLWRDSNAMICRHSIGDWFASISCKRNVTKKDKYIYRCDGKLTYADTKSIDYVSVQESLALINFSTNLFTVLSD